MGCQVFSLITWQPPLSWARDWSAVSIMILMTFESRFWHSQLRKPMVTGPFWIVRMGAKAQHHWGCSKQKTSSQNSGFGPNQCWPDLSSSFLLKLNFLFSLNISILSFRHTPPHLWVFPYEYDSVRKHCSLLHYFAAGKVRCWDHLEVHIKKQKFSFASGKSRWVDNQRQPEDIYGSSSKARLL